VWYVCVVAMGDCTKNAWSMCNWARLFQLHLFWSHTTVIDLFMGGSTEMLPQIQLQLIGKQGRRTEAHTPSMLLHSMHQRLCTACIKDYALIWQEHTIYQLLIAIATRHNQKLERENYNLSKTRDILIYAFKANLVQLKKNLSSL
jgi:hypothetical protein